MTLQEREFYKKLLFNYKKIENYNQFLDEVENYVKSLKFNTNFDELFKNEKIEVVFDNKLNSFARGKIEIGKDYKKIVIYTEVIKKEVQKQIFTFDKLIEI
ncbi:MAG: hypothetical protein ACRC5G_08090, partial [Cetobacterium sp.]